MSIVPVIYRPKRVAAVADGWTHADPIHYWNLDESSGTRVDCQGSLDLTDNNTVAAVAAKVNNGDDFTSANSEYLSNASPAILNGATAATWMYWVNHDTGATYQGIISRLDSGQEHFEIRTTIGVAERTWGCAIDSAYSNYGYINAEDTYAVDTWYHHAWVYDGSLSGNANRLKFFLDKSQQTLTFVGTIPASLKTSTSNLEIGRGRYVNRYMDGIIDEIGIWDSALTNSTGIDDHYALTTPC